jgi:hypothetical protein
VGKVQQKIDPRNVKYVFFIMGKVQQKFDPRNVKYILKFQFKWDHNELDLKLIMNDYLCEITKTQITLTH